MTTKANCGCLTEKIADQAEDQDLELFRETVRSYCHVIESDLVAERRQGITWENYPALGFLDLLVGELDVARQLAVQKAKTSDEWEEELGQAIRELAGTAVLGLMALAGDLQAKE
jgi:hypothetical protein